MIDLRESGNIEQDADVIILLHRESYYKKKGGDDDISNDNSNYADGPDENDNTAELIIEKQRNGPTGTVKLTWIPIWTRFVDHSNAPDFSDY